MVKQKNSAKAVIFNNEKVLMLRKEYEDGTLSYTLPGGTQEPGEELDKTVIREVYEETGAKVEVLDLVNVYEHKHHSRGNPDIIKHKLEFAFLCRFSEPYELHNGEDPAPHQVAVQWIDVDLLNGLNLNPTKLAEIIPSLSLSEQRIYLGDIS